MIRQAKMTDLEMIAKIHLECWNETYTDIIDQDVIDQFDLSQRIELWNSVLLNQNHKVYVYEQQGDICGFIDGYFCTDDLIVYIRALYLLKNQHLKGIGRGLFNQVRKLADEQQFKKIQLDVLNKNSSRYFYEKLGGSLFFEEDASDLGHELKSLYYRWLL